MIEQITSAGHDVKTACELLDVSRAGYYHWKDRPLSARAIRNAWLSDLIVEIHTASRGTYGAPRVHAELRLGRDVVVGHRQVANLDRRPLHEARHSAASLMLSNGVPLKVVQETLDHSTIRLTADTYGHLMPEDEDRAAQAVDDALGA